MSIPKNVITVKRVYNIKSVVIASATALVVSSCGIYSKYETPATVVDNIAGDDVELIDDSLVGALPTWQEMFCDEYLASYINTALENNSDLRVAELNVSQAERGLSTARMAYLPSLSLSAEGVISSFDGATASKSYNIPLTASWEVDLFGKIRNAKQISKAAFAESKEYTQLVRTQLIAAVASNYYSLVLASKQLDIATQSVEVMRENVEVIKSLKEVGKQNQAAVAQSSASLKEMELTLKSIEQSVALIENNLSLLLNETPQKRVHSEEFIINRDSELTKSISLSALSQRPDVRLAEMALCSSFYGVNYARSQLYPSIRLTGSAAWTNSGGGMIVNPGAMLLSAIGSITQPLFMANSNRANLKNAKDQYEQQLLSFEKALLSGGKEVNDAMISINATSEKIALTSERVEMLASATDITRELMDSGKATYLEVLIAQNTYLAAQLNQATLDYDECVERITLFKALGGGRNIE